MASKKQNNIPDPIVPKSPPPDAAYVMSLYRLKINEADEARLIRLAWEFRRLTRMTNELRIPDAYKAIAKEVRTPYIRDTWHRAVAALNNKPYVVHIEPRDKTIEAQKACALGETWDIAVREALDKEINLDTSIESSKALIRDGESVLKVVHRPDAWANFPSRTRGEASEMYVDRARKYKKGAPLPFAWRVVDRLTTVWQDGEFGDEWVIELAEYPRAFMARRYGMSKHPTEDRLIDPANPFVPATPINWSWDENSIQPENLLQGMPKPWGWQNTPFGRCMKAEYFDAEWWTVVIDGTTAPGFPKPNPYAPFIPYFRAKGPDSESLLYSLLFLAPALDELLTMKLNWAHLSAYPNPIVSQIPNQVAGQFPTGDDALRPNLEWKPGKLIVFPPGWQLSFMQPPPTGEDLNQLITLYQQLIEVAGIPSIMRGISGSQDSGYLANQMLAVASLAFKMASEAQARQFSKAFEFLHWMVPNMIGQDVYALATATGEANNGDNPSQKLWVALRAGDGFKAEVAGVDEFGPVEVIYRAMLPTDEQARAMIASQLVNSPKPLLSQRHAMTEYLQIEDPDEILDEIAIEDAMRQEPLASLILNEAMKDAGLMPAAPPPSPTGGPPGAAGPPGINDAANGGEPAIPMLNQPLQQPPPAQGRRTGHGGRAPGAFPGRPPNPVQQIPPGVQQ